MPSTNMAVPTDPSHKHIKSTSRGDTMSQQEEYAATYEFGKRKSMLWLLSQNHKRILIKSVKHITRLVGPSSKRYK